MILPRPLSLGVLVVLAAAGVSSVSAAFGDVSVAALQAAFPAHGPQYCRHTLKDGKAWFIAASTEEECETRWKGTWTTRQEFRQDPVAAFVDAVSTAKHEACETEKGRTRRHWWYAKLEEGEEHHAGHREAWERIIGTSIETLHVSQHGRMIEFEATCEDAKKLEESHSTHGLLRFSHLHPLPSSVLVSPDVEVSLEAGTIDDHSAVHVNLVPGSSTRRSRARAERAVEEVIEAVESIDACDGVTVCTVGDVTDDALHVKNIPAGSVEAVARAAAQAEDVNLVKLMLEVTFANDDAQWAVQSGNSQTEERLFWTKGITGAGLVTGMADSGLDWESCFFKDATRQITVTANQIFEDLNQRKVVQYAPFASTGENEVSGHGTHVGGSIVGSSTTTGQAQHNGIAYNAKIAVYDIGRPNAPSLDLPLPGLHENLFPPSDRVGAQTHCNSWGSASSNYDELSRDFDRFQWENQDFLVLVAAGNSGRNGVETVGTPATAKNIVAVGAALNGASHEQLVDFSSRGPTADGRFKPDVCAPGVQISSARSIEAPTGVHCTTADKSGTSMATPVTTGTALLIIDYLQQGFYPTGKRESDDGFRPMATLVKALLIASGRQMTSPNAQGTVTPGRNGADTSFPNLDQGFGSQVAGDVMFFSGESDHALWLDGSFGDNCNDCPRFTGAGQSRTVTFEATGDEIRFTLVWSEPAAQINTNKALINDLDLEVSSNGQTWYPNGCRAANSPAWCDGERDNTNNVERVIIANPTAGALYRMTVSARTLQVGPVPYSLVVHGGIKRNADLFPNHAPRVSSAGYTNSQLTLSGSRLGTSSSDLSPTITCGSTTVTYTATASTDGASALFDLDDAACAEGAPLSVFLLVNGFTTEVSDITETDASVAKTCNDLTGDVCAGVPDCELLDNRCKVTEEASARTGVKNRSEGGDGVNVAAAVVVPLLLLSLIVGYVLYRKGYLGEIPHHFMHGGQKGYQPNAQYRGAQNATAIAMANSQYGRSAGPTPAAMSKPTTLPRLPANWEAVADPDSGDTYYWNAKTGETTWERPRPVEAAAVAEEPPPPPAAKRTSLPPGWEAVLDPDSGDTYYWNADTGDVAWEQPTA